jgi:hypothetical protein
MLQMSLSSLNDKFDRFEDNVAKRIVQIEQGYSELEKSIKV